MSGTITGMHGTFMAGIRRSKFAHIDCPVDAFPNVVNFQTFVSLSVSIVSLQFGHVHRKAFDVDGILCQHQR